MFMWKWHISWSGASSGPGKYEPQVKCFPGSVCPAWVWVLAFIPWPVRNIRLPCRNHTFPHSPFLHELCPGRGIKEKYHCMPPSYIQVTCWCWVCCVDACSLYLLCSNWIKHKSRKISLVRFVFRMVRHSECSKFWYFHREFLALINRDVLCHSWTFLWYDLIGGVKKHQVLGSFKRKTSKKKNPIL